MRNKKPKIFSIDILGIFLKIRNWRQERKAEKDTDLYLRLNREYSPEQAKRIWIQLKRRRKKRWWKF